MLCLLPANAIWYNAREGALPDVGAGAWPAGDLAGLSKAKKVIFNRVRSDEVPNNRFTCRSRPQAILFLVFAALLWSSGGLFIKVVAWHPLAIAGIRSFFSALVIGLFFGRRVVNFSRAQMAGAAAYAGMVIMLVVSTKLTTAANAIFLQYTAPVYVALLSYVLLREKISRGDWWMMGLVFGGMTLFFLDDLSWGSLAGNLFGIGSGLSFAAFAIALRLQKGAAPAGSVLLGNLLTFLIGIPFYTAPYPDAAGWGALVILGVFQLGFSYYFYTEAISYVTALEAVLIPVIEPVLNPVWVFLVLGERPGPLALIGGAIVLLVITVRCALKAGRS